MGNNNEIIPYLSYQELFHSIFIGMYSLIIMYATAIVDWYYTVIIINIVNK